MPLPATIKNTAAALASAIHHQSVISGDMPYLRLLKDGIWVYGGDDIEVEEGSQWAVNTESFGMGFQAWEDSELVGEEIAPVTAPPILKSDLSEVGGEWRPLISCHLACISGTDKGIQVLYKTTSKGGVKALKKLMQELVDRFTDKPNAKEFVPVVELGMTFYKHSKWGKIYTPVLDIVDWIANAPDAAASKPEVAAEAPELEEETPTAAPKRRRRRATS